MNEQLTERYCVLVNGHAVEPGCWVDGHWGQYGPDHLADRAEELGWVPDGWSADPRQLRSIADTIGEWGYVKPPLRLGFGTRPIWGEGEGIFLALHEVASSAADEIEAWLNDNTETEGYSWGWHDGEFYLWPTETWEESD